MLDKEIERRKESFGDAFFDNEMFDFIEDLGDKIRSNKRKIFICGNGGSASQASHFAAELMGRYRKKRNCYFAIPIGSDYAINTALANDFGYENSYALQLENMAKMGDILIALSTSGNSKNIIRALEIGKELKMFRCLLTGKNGGEAVKYADLCYVDKCSDTAIIQEHHLILIHLICEYLEIE